jgi:hypothetical protein
MDGTGELFQPFLIALKNEFKTIVVATFVRNPRPNLRYLLPLLRAIPLNWIPSPIIRFFFLGSLANQQSCAQLLKVLRSVDQAVLVHRFQSLVAVDVADELQLIDVPLLYFDGIPGSTGTRDRGGTIQTIAAMPDSEVRCASSPFAVKCRRGGDSSQDLSDFVGRTGGCRR